MVARANALLARLQSVQTTTQRLEIDLKFMSCKRINLAFLPLPGISRQRQAKPTDTRRAEYSQYRNLGNQNSWLSDLRAQHTRPAQSTPTLLGGSRCAELAKIHGAV